MVSSKKIKLTAEEQDLHLRGESIAVAMQHAKPQNMNVADTLNGAQMIYDWMKGRGLPIQVSELQKTRSEIVQEMRDAKSKAKGFPDWHRDRFETTPAS